MAANLHISISAEPITAIGDFALTNSMFTSLLVSGMLIAFALAVRLSLTNTNKPQGLQNFAEWIIEALHNLIYSTTGDLKKTRLFLPIISSFFLFIILNNWLGLLPGVGTITVPLYESADHLEEQSTVVNTKEDIHELSDTEEPFTYPQAEVAETTDSHVPQVPVLRPGSADLNTTLALAVISVFMTQVFGVQFQHLGYFKKFINFSSPIMFFVGILELVSEFAKIISFAFRLFGNIFAGEVLLVVISALIPLVAPMPFYGLELFVGFIQALVFSMLSLVFFNMATQSHDSH